ncbi:septum formation inhibitor Maf [Synechococcus sp. HB1133]|uniref:Maf family protein n=1 Tax=unclassified Synechococcus TaxID=2626047 RepID=UPI00140B47E9|nr:septum formation inhibitor Maf [Synechococcus sp. PH41509]MCB4422254.1 septum formation inhibitor Maf [Synechococcus sp. HB1133]MCB4429801.1 septum formation inhibitor Maf [Synechococcus sp. HBA1120]NHI81197.1 septum formation inhibitor Maf [Synechococcus sp. HB1133]
MLLLASASPARRRLLEQAGVPHRVRVSGVDEDQIQHADPAELVKLLAQAKAEAVAQALDPVGDAEITAVLGCDSVLSFEGQVFGKPTGRGEAIERWQRMAGCCGSLLTGHCLMRRGQADVLACVETVVRFAPLNQAEIEAYVASGEPLQCAGGFALEGRGGLCIDGLEGCYSNVIGLSLPWLRTVLGQQLA